MKTAISIRGVLFAEATERAGDDARHVVGFQRIDDRLYLLMKMKEREDSLDSTQSIKPQHQLKVYQRIAKVLTQLSTDQSNTLNSLTLSASFRTLRKWTDDIHIKACPKQP